MTSADLTILAPAFAAGLLVLATHVPLGREVLKKCFILNDLSITQLAGLGVIAAHRFGFEAHGWQVQIAAISAALGCALLLTWTEKVLPDIQEALIGSLFVLAASSGILLLAGNPQGGEHLQDMLAGQILWVEWHTLLQTAVLYALVFFLWFRLRPARLGFYALFALTVTTSVQLVGIYLVFASLILPALACRQRPHPLRDHTCSAASATPPVYCSPPGLTYPAAH